MGSAIDAFVGGKAASAAPQVGGAIGAYLSAAPAHDAAYAQSQKFSLPNIKDIPTLNQALKAGAINQSQWMNQYKQIVKQPAPIRQNLVGNSKQGVQSLTTSPTAQHVASDVNSIYQHANPFSGVHNANQLIGQTQQQFGLTPQFVRLLHNNNTSTTTGSLATGGAQAITYKPGTAPNVVNRTQINVNPQPGAPSGSLNNLGATPSSVLVHEGLHQVWATSTPQQKQAFSQVYNQAASKDPALLSYLNAALNVNGKLNLSNISKLPPALQDEIHSATATYYLNQQKIASNNPLNKYYSQYLNLAQGNNNYNNAQKITTSTGKSAPATIGAFLKNMGAGFVQSENTVAKGISRTLPGGLNDVNATNQQAQSANAAVKQAISDMKAGKITPAVANHIIQLNAGNAMEAQQQQQANLKSMPTKGQLAAGFAGTAADIITGGALPELKGTSLASRLGNVGYKSSALGLAGGLNAASAGGTKKQIAENFALGAAFPVALHGVGLGASKLQKVINDAHAGKIASPEAKATGLPLDKSGNPIPSNRSGIKTGQAAPTQPTIAKKGLGEAGGVGVPKVNDYVKQQIALQEKARKAGSPQGLAKIGAGKSEAKTKLIDSFAPIEDTLNKSIKAGAKVAPEQNIKYQIDRAIRADTIGAQYIKDNGLAKVIQGADNTKELDQYLIAKHAADLEKQGIQTGRNLPADQQLIKDLGAKYEPHAKVVKQYSENLLDKAVSYGLVSKEVAAGLKTKYPNYVPVNRIFGEGELQPIPKGLGGGKASLSTQTAVQGIKGSTRQIESPLASLVDKTQTIIKQGEQNKAAQILTSYKDLPGNPFELTPLRTAENVQRRVDIYKELSQSRPAVKKLETMLRSGARQERKATGKVNELEKRGLAASLSRAQTKNVKPILSGVRDTLKNARTITGETTQPLLKSNAITGTVTTQQFSRSLTAQETKNLVNNLVNNGRSEVDRILKRRGYAEDKLKAITQQVDSLRAAVEGVHNNRAALYDESKLLRDAESRGKATISTYRNGIKEIYETTPEIASAAKSLNKQQLGLVGKILSAPTRVLRLGATGLNPAFALSNVAKDTASAFINSSHPLRASVANPKVFLQALTAATRHGSKEYGELVREAAGGTSFDIARNAPKQNIRTIRMQRNLPSNILYTVTNPAQLLRAAENTIGRSEEFNRAIQYFGNKQAAIKKGLTVEQAKLIAADAARNNTVNFARAGDYGRVVNSTLPYLNAGVQGSRTLLRNLKDRPIQTGAKLAVTAFFPTAVVTAWNTSDPKRKAAYDDIKEYEKQGSLVIVPPNPVKDPKTGKWNVIKIPVSQEIANLNNIVRQGVETAVKDKTLNLASLIGNTIGTTTSLNTQSPRQLVGQLTPQAIKPGVESLVNQNLFTGNKIVPDSQKNLAPRDQIGPGTSKLAVQLGKVSNLSPRQIDNAISTSTGGLGTSVAHGKSLGNQISGRFVGAQGQSDYDKADTQFKSLSSQLQKFPEYKRMTPADKAKALNRLQSTVSAALLPSTNGKPKKLSARQRAIVNKNPDLGSYLKAQR